MSRKALPLKMVVLTLIGMLLLTIPKWGAGLLATLGLVAPFGDWHLITFPWTVVGISVRSAVAVLGVCLIIGGVTWLLSQIKRYEDPNEAPDQVLDVVGRGRDDYGSSYGGPSYGADPMMGMGGMPPMGGPSMGGMPPMGGGPMGF